MPSDDTLLSIHSRIAPLISLPDNPSIITLKFLYSFSDNGDDIGNL